MFPVAITIAVLGAIESLLSATVADGVIGDRHDSNTELIAQGAANIIAPLFGGIPATGAIARTMTNINNGGKTPIAGIIHAVVLLLILLFLMPLAQYIRWHALPGVLVIVSYNMSGWRTVVKVVKTSPKSDIAVLVLTFFLTVVFDLVVAIAVGLTLACLLFMTRMADVAVVREWEYVEDTQDDQGRFKPVPAHVMVYEATGPCSSEQRTRSPIWTERRTSPSHPAHACRPRPGYHGAERPAPPVEECCRQNIQMVFSHVNEQPMSVFQKSGLLDEVGRENFQPNIDAALDRAAQLEGVAK